MKILLQRVRRAQVTVDDDVIAQIGVGVVLLVGFGRDDAEVDLARAAQRIVDLRIFANDDGKLDRSLREIGAAVLAVPQFTLLGRTDKGRRPDFTQAMAPEAARARFDAMVAALRGVAPGSVECGRFGADMRVELVNDGPFTLMLEF